MAGHDPAVTLIDSMPVPVRRFARAHRCRSLRDLSAFGYDPVAHQTYYGLRLRLRIAWPGVITAAVLAPANEADRSVAPQLLAGLAGWALGDKGYRSPALRAELATGGLDPIAPPPGGDARARRGAPRPGATRRGGATGGGGGGPRGRVKAGGGMEPVRPQPAGPPPARGAGAGEGGPPAARGRRKPPTPPRGFLLCRGAGLPPLAFAQLL